VNSSFKIAQSLITR